MTQHDAKTAVKRIKRKIAQIIEERDLRIIIIDLREVLEDVTNLELGLETVKKPMPNCRPATKDELAALCASSNVVAFRPAA